MNSINTSIHFEPFHPDHECSGHILLDFENALGSERIHPIFVSHGIDLIDPDAWYPVQPYFAALNEIASGDGSMLDFVSVGMKQVETAIIPPEYYEMPVEEVLEQMDFAYRLNNRGTDVGEVRADVIGNGHVKMYLRVPHPDHLWYGVCFGYMKRLTRNVDFTVSYDEEFQRHDHGGDYTVIDITWRAVK